MVLKHDHNSLTLLPHSGEHAHSLESEQTFETASMNRMQQKWTHITFKTPNRKHHASVPVSLQGLALGAVSNKSRHPMAHSGREIP